MTQSSVADVLESRDTFLEKPARLIIRLLFGFASDDESICQTQYKYQLILKYGIAV